MPAPVTTASVWKALATGMFGVLAWTAPDGSPRSAGIVYVVRDRRLYIGTASSSWKARQIRTDGRVSLTATLERRIPLLPWVRIPAATITFRARAEVIEGEAAEPTVIDALTAGMADPDAMRADLAILELHPEGDFLTYGIDTSLLALRDPERAQGRASVGADASP